METAYQISAQESRPELVLPVRQIRPDGLVDFKEYQPSAADKAYWILREKIIRMELPPGSAIRDTDLTSILSIGRTPIREALKRLEVEMLVVSHHRKGTYVNSITLVDIKRQYQVRRQLLTLAVALASQAGETVRSMLERKANSLAACAETCNGKNVVQSIEELEINIAKASGNPFLCSTLQQYSGYARRTWHLLDSFLTLNDLQIQDYPVIMEGVLNKDGEGASQAMAYHVDQVHLKVVDRFLKKFI